MPNSVLGRVKEGLSEENIFKLMPEGSGGMPRQHCGGGEKLGEETTYTKSRGQREGGTSKELKREVV